MAKNRKGSSKSGASKSSSTSKQHQPSLSTLDPLLRSPGGGSVSSSRNKSNTTAKNNNATPPPPTTITLREILNLDGDGMYWIIGVLVLGSLIGFFLGTRVFSTPLEAADHHPGKYQASFFGFFAALFKGHRHFLLTHNGLIVDTPDNPRYFAVLREAVVREKGGYVHPDLGMLYPAPSGAVRGMGMVRDTYRECQAHCFPGSDHERDDQRRDMKFKNDTKLPLLGHRQYGYEDILIRVPLPFQMTRQVAIDTLSSKFSTETQRRFLELDDAAMLVLLLAHERAIGRYSRWHPYIALLPPRPTCGYLRSNRKPILDAIAVYREQLHVDTEGWQDEMLKAMVYSESIVEALTTEYGGQLKKMSTVSTQANIEWALCQVASRATAASEKHGSLRLVPLVDMINHHLSAGGFLELTGQERRDKGDPCDASEDESGTFIVRSLRHGRRKPLRKGQELMVNYNVPHYSALDWLVSLGFVPEERWDRWTKLEPALPQLRRDGPFAPRESAPTEQIIRERDDKVREQLLKMEL